MLRTRIVTGLVLAAGLAGALFLLPPLWLFFFMLSIAVLASIEWARLFQLKSKPAMATFAAAVALASFALYLMQDYGIGLLLFGTVLWCVLALHVIRSKGGARFSIAYPVIAVAALSFAVFSISHLLLHAHFFWALGLFAVVCLADIAAYFSGKRFGRRPLAPSISPGKTVEGLIGALLAVFAAALASGTLLWENQFLQVILWGAVCLIAAMFSVIGDLFVSLNKRRANVKDSGNLIPGHGGVLDRIDSTLAASPIYALCVLTLFK